MSKKNTKTIKKIKTKEEELGEILFELEKDLSKFQITVEKKGKTMQQYVKLLKLTETEYHKIFQENKKIKEKIEIIERNNKEKPEKKRIKKIL